MTMKTFQPSDADQRLHTDIANLIARHLTPESKPDRVLAIAAQVVGQALALQDQRKMTKEMALDLIMANIEMGNQGVIARLHDTKGEA